ncbi:aminotransferase class I/II-fold pyridoxal phosphate-dependent enzyme [Patulibacter sp. SYSU D01012]|uniref:aminotransferase class I/II-fold pyridoxal phosphate-dependent enzyme n=1 Tax=Patulibacter sp. SYSU D01012 TaxID=2817381 RepID=UPI001B312B0C|nr:aminotransferase class I/II-fold pyridoxal phosphate-dependent enzyme [Patulibacter sp. SYSU D01012]
MTDPQPIAPYFDAVVAYGLRGPSRFHVPGHKGGSGADPALRHAIGDRALAMDIPQDIHGVDTGGSPTPYERAEALAADAHGAARTFFLTNGATQGNHALTLALAPQGAHVVVQRNSHASIVDGLVLSGGTPSFVAPEYDDELGMALGVSPEALRTALEQDPTARAAFVVSPTYYGIAADVQALADVAHEHGVALVVDQSWGPHFGFHPGVPESALRLGADAVLTSTHKIAGSLTQSAMLHVADSGLVPIDDVARTLRLLRSTSPSSLLMGSLDAARRQIAVHGEALLHETIAAVATLHAKIRRTDGLDVLDDGLRGRPGVGGWDPLRVVVDVRGLGRTGYEVADALRTRYDGNVELATHAVVVLLVGLAEDPIALQRVGGDLDEIALRLRRPHPGSLVRAPRAPDVTPVLPPREAFLGRGEDVDPDVAAAEGRVCAESIAGYPPGIPAILPGERVSPEIVAYLRELVAAGARLHGAADPTLGTIRVLPAGAGG